MNLPANNGNTKVTPTLADIAASFTIDEEDAASTDVHVEQGGHQTVLIAVTAQNGAKKNYSLTLYRPVSTDATLSAIHATYGVLSPATLSPAITKYTLTLAEGEGNTEITPVTTSETATYKIDGHPWLSEPVYLDNNAHKTVTIVVKPQVGKSKTYTIKVTRMPSTNRDLGSLNATYGTFDYALTSDRTEYTLTLGEYQNSTKISVTKGIKYQSVSPMSKNVSLDTGKSAKVVFTVKPQSGLKKTYTITVKRNPSTDATLKSLKGVTLAPTFNKDMLTYTATVSAKTKSVTLSPTVYNKNAKVAYYDNKTGLPCTKKITLTNPGDSFEVEVRVTAQDGSVRHYYITITRNPA